jgi:drug/metabolite transporter (DMT)-like permease
MKDAAWQPVGYLYVMLAAVLWGISGTLSKSLFQNGISPFQLLQLRTTIAVAVLFVWLLLRRRRLFKVSGKDVSSLALLGIGLAAVQFTYLFTISKIQVAAAILLQYQAPVLLLLYDLLLVGEKLSVKTTGAVIGASVGCYLLVGAYDLDLLHLNRAGIAGGLSSALAFAWYSASSERAMRKYDPWTVIFYALLFAAATSNALYRPLSSFAPAYTVLQWASVCFISVMGTLLSFGFYNQGIKIIRATHASITGIFEPMTAALISYIFLGETLGRLQLTGAVLIIGSVLLLQLRIRPGALKAVQHKERG